MRTIRFPIKGLMGAVIVVALGLAALRDPSEIWSGIMFLLTCGVLCLAIVGVVCRQDEERAWWLGFALFGWGYLLLSMRSTVVLPTLTLLDSIAARLGAPFRFSGGMGGMGGGMRSIGLWAFGGFGGPTVDGSVYLRQEIAHCLWALLAALLGGILARVIFGSAKKRDEKVDPPAQTANQAHGRRSRWWLWPAGPGLVGGGLMLALVLTASRSSPGFWVGATFLTTCALLGITILGVVGEQGRRRQVWLGAAIFGVSYMAMAFGRSLDGETWPTLPTDHLLETIRPWFPPVVSGFPTSSDGIAALNARMWETLQRPVSMHFPEETPLEDVLKYIQTKTSDLNGNKIPIYIDTLGFQEAERSPTSVVTVDLENVPLKISLRLCLKQLGLTYRIRDGLLFITSEESAILPVYQDPFLIAGHCVLALLAAVFGGAVAPLFCAKPTAHAAP